MLFGDREGLQFELEWSSQDRSLARGRLKITLRNSIIWSDEDGRGVNWTWIEILEYLASAWPFLKYDESFPAWVDGSEAIKFLQHGGPREDTEYGYTPSISTEDYIFLRRHNLATGIDGLYLPPLSILREGLNARILSGYVVHVLPVSALFKLLSEFGDAIAEYLSDSDDERSKSARDLWANREPSINVVRKIKLGGSGALYNEVFGNMADSLPDEPLNDDVDYDSPLLAAARMTFPAPEEARKVVLRTIKECRFNETAKLDELSQEAKTAWPKYANKPFEQGYHLARWARQKLGIHPRKFVEPKDILESLNIEVIQLRLNTPVIDAVGCWGRGHGPAVIVNYDGEHAQEVQGRRATLAHELAHLLVDRDGSLPAAEVLGGATPGIVEQRANAFAAEFLLPSEAATAFLDRLDYTTEALFKLREHYLVSKELAGWQIKHGQSYNSLGPSEKRLVDKWIKGEDEELYL